MSDNYAEYLFCQGTNVRAYEYLGAHRQKDGSYTFRVWAPNADTVYLCGDFCDWENGIPMSRDEKSEVWEYSDSLSGVNTFTRYKYIIERNGKRTYKSDPFAFMSETNEKTASLLFELDGYEWNDADYLENRKRLSEHLTSYTYIPEPVNIYEIHLGSWDRNLDGSYLTYLQSAERVIPYVKKMGYTHIELLPVTEYPYDGSWGYQCCGYFAPTSRYGTPHEFMHFIDECHAENIGVILDWVPAHFPKDEHGLFEFDGGRLYEYQGDDRAEHKVWGTRYFDLGRPAVQSFLISCAVFWCEKYHIDGLRSDAVASMLYLDYDREPGEWFPNPDGSNTNIQGVEFIKKLNSSLNAYYPDVLRIAEESTSFPRVTESPENGGLGFHMKWNMGWMNDTLTYMGADSINRKYMHDRMTFSLMYTFGERYVLPISHDEVVHGKKSLLDKMFGNYDGKFSSLRAYMTYMMTHPGKKLLFMGCEYGQFSEWDEKKALEWFMLDYERHRQLHEFCEALNHFYLSEKSLWECDGSWDGFEWLEVNDADDSVLIYKRLAEDGSSLVIVLNFTPVKRPDFWANVGTPGIYEEVLNSDDIVFGGTGVLNPSAHASREAGGKNYIVMDMMPLGASVWRKTGELPKITAPVKKKIRLFGRKDGR
ncbi:MAG TPA: 1,4-alpha-glucan branching protein GlgB [Bacillota bacterium]|nr:1,4-alpha-glucan branching protein GlgB [Bacillota bacterium]